MLREDIVIRMAGTAGEGALVLGDILAQALARLGWGLLLHFSFEAEVRGEKPSYSQLRVSKDPPLSQGGGIDLLLGLNRAALELNLPELSAGGIVLYDGRPIDPFRGEETYEPPLPDGVTGFSVPFEVISQRDVAFPASKNIAALGALTYLLGLPFQTIQSSVENRFKRKGDKVVDANMKALDMGHESLSGIAPPFAFGESGTPRLLLSGNRAASLGAMAGGCRFFAGYPITPATEVMEYLAHDLPGLGGTVIQAEDEIAALGMVLGASYSGARAMTATSGPGLSLMSEMLGLASASEVPAVVLDVQRGGPSTGLPTRPEQSDLNIALYGSHGEAPRIVLAPTNVEECFYATGRALGLAEKYQMPVIILSDQYLSYRRETLDGLDPDKALSGGRLKPTAEELKDYKRYRITDDGISPMSVPGEEGGLFVATGLTHNEVGLPAYDASTHMAMLKKRSGKLKTAARFDKWFERFGADDASIGVIAWGSVVGAAKEAVHAACESGINACVFYTVFLNPLPEDEIREFIRPLKRLIIPEMNHTGQFARLIRERFLVEPVSIALPLGVPFPVEAILEAIKS